MVVSAEFDSEGPGVIPMGETETTTHSVGNGGVVPVHVFLGTSGDGTSVDRSRMRVPARSGANTAVSLTAPPQTGSYRFLVTEYRYRAILPQPMVTTLYHRHYWLPIVVIDGLVSVPYYPLGAALVGSRSVRVNDLSRDEPASVRIRRAIRRLYPDAAASRRRREGSTRPAGAIRSTVDRRRISNLLTPASGTVMD